MRVHYVVHIKVEEVRNAGLNADGTPVHPTRLDQTVSDKRVIDEVVVLTAKASTRNEAIDKVTRYLEVEREPNIDELRRELTNRG